MNFSRLPVLALLTIAVFSSAGTSSADEFRSLFDGKTLRGWRGDAQHWSVKDGAIVGSTKPNGRKTNTFLILNEHFGDFILKAQFRYTTGGSGIQLRSQPAGKPNEYRVVGYQADIGGGDLGTFYEEKGRGNLVKSDFKTLEPHINKGDWNSYEIKAVGSTFELKVNDRITAKYSERDRIAPPRGLIALQLQAGAGMEIAFRDIKIKSLDPPVDTTGNGRHVIGPTYTLQNDLKDQGNPKGQLFQFSMPLADSKIFDGKDKTLDRKKPVRKARKIWVYVPAAYKDGTPAPILVTHDGPSRLDLVRNAVDNLSISKDPNRRLPAFITIAVQNGGNDSKGSQRGLEYDTMSDRYARFINDEVLPAVLNNADIQAAYPNIAFTQDPWGKATMGCSSGGAAALTMGWFRPDLFRRLITYSGTFVDQQDDDAAEEKAYPGGAWEYHSDMKLIERTPNKPLRIFTHVAEFDNRFKDPEETLHNWVMANERTAAALEAKGYNYRYVFSKASRHCDGRVFQHTLADTLVWMWRGYEPDAVEK